MAEVSKRNKSPSGNTQQPVKSKLQLETMKMLDTSRKKLTTIEAQRIMAVLNDALQRLELVALLRFACKNLERYSVMFGNELCAALENFNVLINKFVSNLEQKAENPEDECNLQKHSDLLQLELHHSTKFILRLFAANPTIIKAFLQEKQQIDPTVQSFLNEVVELCSLVHTRLLTTPMEEKQCQDYLNEVKDRARKNSLVIKKLEKELDAALAEKDVEVGKRNDQIKKLKASIYKVEKASEDTISRTRNDAIKLQQADEKNTESKREKLLLELNAARSALASSTADHRKSEQALRTRKFQKETEVDQLISKYDSDMGEKQAEWDEIDAQYSQEKSQLRELEEKYNSVEEEYARIIEEQRLAREKQIEDEKYRRAATRSALCIQRFWRAYRVRRAAKKKNKKGKKSGKGKGK